VIPPILTFLIILSIVVLIHELGHFLVAKWVGVKVEEFGYGFPPRAIGKKIGETIYSINWLPIGGFVKLFGEQEAEAEGSKDPRAFFNKSKKQRSAVIVAGVVMNMVLAVICFSVIYSIVGIPEKVNYLVVDQVAPDSVPQNIGLKEEDKILAVNGSEISDVDGFRQIEKTADQNPLTLTVKRDGQEIAITPEDWQDLIIIKGIEPGSPAQEAGFELGDKIVSLDGEKVNDVQVYIDSVKAKAGSTIILEVIRAGELMQLSVVPRENPGPSKGAIGVAIGYELSVSDYDNVFYPAWQMPFRGTKVGLEEAYNWTKEMFTGLAQMVGGIFSGHVPEVMGVVGMYGVTKTVAAEGILPLIKFMGILSINLAVINILPFPALDGGRLAFIMLEKVIGRKIKPKIEAYINMAGMVVLLSLMALVTVADVLRVVRGG